MTALVGFGGFGGPEIALREAGIGNMLPPGVYRAILKSLGIL